MTVTDYLENLDDTRSVVEAVELLPETLGEGTLIDGGDLGTHGRIRNLRRLPSRRTWEKVT